MTPSAAVAAPTAREVFLEKVRAAELFAPAQMSRVEAAVPAAAMTATEAATALVAAGHLTRFQAERLLAGRTEGFVLGPYVILEQVGRGAMGRVYKARHRTMNRPVAIKVLGAELTRTTVARRAFQQEVRAAARLNHPNIVVAYDANELDDRFYLVHEFVDGPNFETLVRERGPLHPNDAGNLVRQTALGLSHAHGLGMVHRNLKPANLLITQASRGNPENVVKIADFGIARRAPAAAGPLLVGDPDYLAPELALRPDTADPRSDLYSLGAILHFLLVGRPPFPGGTVEEKLRMHAWAEPTRIDRLRPDVHPAVATLVNQLLAKKPEARPANAEEVADRLSGSFGAGANGVNFDLPSPQVGPYSFAAAPSTGMYPVAPPSGQCSPVIPAPSPWEQITEECPGSPPSRARSFLPSLWMSGILASMLLASAAAVGVLVKVVGK